MKCPARIFYITVIFFFVHLSVFSIDKKLIGHNIMVSVSSETGRFTLYGRHDTESKWIPLVFEESPTTPSSTFFRFFKDNIPVNFGSGGKENQTSITFVDDSIKYVWENREIKIELLYTLVPSKIDQPLDTLFIDVDTVNKTNADYVLDFNLCIDTYLGEKVKKHFILPGNVLYNKESQIVHESMVSYIKSFNDRMDLGLYIYLGETKQVSPDRIYFANWKRIEEASDMFQVVEGRNFDLKPYSIGDSALVIEYRNKPLLYDKKSSYRFILSMGNTFTYEEQAEKDTDESADASLSESETDSTFEGTEQDKTTDSITSPDQELGKLTLTELLEMLDSINERIDSGELTEKDIEFADEILEEIKRR